MNFVHLMNGEKGGVGKSKYCRVFLEYHRVNNIAYKLFDVDRTNPDVGMIYAPEEYSDGTSGVYFSNLPHETHYVDAISDEAENQSVIVNLPAQIMPLLDRWIQKNRLFSLFEENGIKFVNWFLCTGGYDSIELFKKFVDKYENSMIHVLVKNHGLCFGWNHLDDDMILQNILLKSNVYEINFPALDYRERNQIDRLKITLSAAKNERYFGMTSKQKIKNFLCETWDEIDRVYQSLPTQAAPIESPVNSQTAISFQEEVVSFEEEVEDSNGNSINGQVATSF